MNNDLRVNKSQRGETHGGEGGRRKGRGRDSGSGSGRGVNRPGLASMGCLKPVGVLQVARTISPAAWCSLRGTFTFSFLSETRH